MPEIVQLSFSNIVSRMCQNESESGGAQARRWRCATCNELCSAEVDATRWVKVGITCNQVSLSTSLLVVMWRGIYQMLSSYQWYNRQNSC